MSNSQALAPRQNYPAQQQQCQTVQMSRQELINLVDDPKWRNDAARAVVLANSPKLVPDWMVGDPLTVLSCMWALETMGADVNVVTMSQIYNVHGRPGVMAQLMLGLAHAAGHSSRWVTQTDELQAIEMDGQVFSFSIEQARKAGLTTGSNKQTWASYTSDMLGWKAVARAVRRCCPEVLMGLHKVAPQLMGEEAPVEAVGELPQQAPEAPQQTSAVAGAAPAPSEDATAVDGPSTTSVTDQPPAAEMYSQPKAMQELVAAGTQAGLDDLQAKMLASKVWADYRLKAPIDLGQIGILLRAVRHEAAQALGQVSAGGINLGEVGTPAENTVPIDENFDGSNAEGLPF